MRFASGVAILSWRALVRVAPQKGKQRSWRPMELIGLVKELFLLLQAGGETIPDISCLVGKLAVAVEPVAGSGGEQQGQRQVLKAAQEAFHAAADGVRKAERAVFHADTQRKAHDDGGSALRA